MFVDLLLSSFAVWPVLSQFPDLKAVGSMFFVERFDELMRLMLLLAAPALCVLTLLEFGFGLINRYSPQLNVFTLSMSLKSWFAILHPVAGIGTTMAISSCDWLGGQRDLIRLLPLYGHGLPMSDNRRREDRATDRQTVARCTSRRRCAEESAT